MNKFNKIALEHFLSTYTTVTDDESCWLWNGLIDKRTGYGRTSYLESLPKQTTAHKTVFTLFYGKPLDKVKGRKICVRHLCHNKLCINPKHLSLGTYSDNAVDSSIFGRGVVMNKEMLIKAISLRNKGYTYNNIGKILGVNGQTVSQSLRGKTLYCRELLKEINNERELSKY